MKILISQPFGIGDCIFSMQIARNWIKEGHSVTWPVFTQFVEQLRRAYPEVNWVDWTTIKAPYERQDEHDWNGYRYVPLRWANEIMGGPYANCMRNKYDLLHLDWESWREGAMWERDSKKEKDLFSRVNKFGPYRLVNNTFGSDGKLTVSIKLEPFDQIMNIRPDFSLFDWAKVLENASEIHTVSTSIIYILEMLDIACPIHIYKREPIEKNHDNYSYILTKPNYILH